MPAILYSPHPLSISLAGALLSAWILGDARKVSAELDRSLFAESGALDGQEAERMQLIKAIAQRMQTCPDLFAAPSTDPALDLCVDLLAHLAGKPGPPD